MVLQGFFFSCACSIDQNVVMYRKHTFQILQGMVEPPLEFFWRWADTKWQTTPLRVYDWLNIFSNFKVVLAFLLPSTLEDVGIILQKHFLRDRVCLNE